MADKKTASRKIDDTVNRSVNFELTIADFAKRSERRAWWVAFTAIIVALILLGGYFYMLPLKEKVPYVIMADAYTGTSSIAHLTEDFTNRQITTSEAINKSNVAHYISARESYDSSTTAYQNGWITSIVMSSPKVATAYKNQIQSTTNPDSLTKLYGQDKALRINILSISLHGAGVGQTPKSATVRFQRSVYDKTSGLTTPLDSKIATLEFTYMPDLRMDDQYRIENPLGFQVTDYRVDNDYESSAPTAVQGAPIANNTQPASATNANTGLPASTSTAITPQTMQTGLPSQPPIPEREAPQVTAPGVPASNNTANGVGHR
ncbi:type IV secretion system protein [Rhodanobacter sp. MP1X3]|uniref:virB8 family protein n=1 Tax=Rhodanobacter sp. MP1X3 TaxID=2723086 RepID=UPI001613380A|nr:type IV secretion system protein [Rhodanobacter sp. MP1X3]MBB6241399.1 type IV secretion system protein VirB8 [Rhodanobacter sp. MP1X3]